MPVTPLGAVLLNIGATSPIQKDGIAAKLDRVCAFTVTLRVCVVAHCPALGVKRYVPLAVLLMVAGFQVPAMPFGEVLLKLGATVPAQKAGIAAKLGVICVLTVTLMVAVVAHVLPVGVNV